MDLRQAIDVVERVMYKEELDKQLTGQVSAFLFMTVKDSKSNSRSYRPHNPQSYRQVTFDTDGELVQKIDKRCNRMSKMATSTACWPFNKP